MGLRNGEVLRLRDLLYGMLLLSGNDAAVATAEAVAGSEKEFVKMMNDYAAEVGAEDTHYTNPHGLHSPDHYSSAYDLALLAREGFKLPEFRRIIALPEAEVKRQSRTQLMKNINRLLTGDEEYYSFANGVKSGYTTPAGNCLVSSAAKNGWTLVAVVLNARDVYGESKKLLEWGFNTFNRTPVLQPGKFIRDIKVEGGRKDLVAVVTGGTLSVPLLDGEKKELEQRVVLPDTVTAPVEEGEWLGEIRLFMDDTRVATVDLVAGSTVKRRSLLTSIWQSLIAILTFH